MVDTTRERVFRIVFGVLYVLFLGICLIVLHTSQAPDGPVL